MNALQTFGKSEKDALKKGNEKKLTRLEKERLSWKTFAEKLEEFIDTL